jgi:hypothetical protein
MEKLDLRKHLAARVIRFLTDRLSPTAGAGIDEISATLLLVDLFGRVPGLERGLGRSGTENLVRRLSLLMIWLYS